MILYLTARNLTVGSGCIQLHYADCAAICRRCYYKKRKQFVSGVFFAASHFFSICAVVKTIAGHLVPYQQSKWQPLFFSVHFLVQHVYFGWALWHPTIDFSTGGEGVVATYLFTILFFLNAVTFGQKMKEKLKLHLRWQSPENFFKSQNIPVANGNINSSLPRRVFYQNRKDDVQTYFFFK